MKIVHAGDLHVWRMGIPVGDLFSIKRGLGWANLLLRRATLFPPEIRENVMEAIRKESPDLVLFTGDFTQSSQMSEFRECARLFAPLRDELGDRLFAIPGNHDVYTFRSVRKRLMESALPWVHTGPVTRQDLPGKLTLVSVNHAEPFRFRSNGVVRPATQQMLREVLTSCREEQRTVILIGHFPYTTPPEHPESPEHQLLGEETFAEVVREFAPPVYAHGHKHVRWAVRPECTPDTVCLNCGSLGMRKDTPEKQPGFLSWQQEENGTLLNLTAHRLNQTGEWRKDPLAIRKV